MLIGFSIAAPVGPIGVLCIRRTLSEGRAAGFASGLGAATADAIYGLVAGFGLTAVSAALLEYQAWIRLVGGLFLCYLGVRSFLARPVEDVEAADRRGGGLLGAYGSTLLLTLTNPVTILAFAAIFAGLNVGLDGGVDYGAAGTLVGGVFVGSALWWLLLSGLTGLFHARITPRTLRWINRVAGVVILGFGVIALVGLLPSDGNGNGNGAGSLALSLPAVAPEEAAGFTRADGSRVLTFPADYGPHPDYQTEWWYYTGNLETAEGRRFGYQLTFFRRGLLPPAQQPERSSAWAIEQVYMAHFALTDVADGQHHAFERFSRGAAGLAGAEAAPYRVWLEDWRVEEIEAEPDIVRLRAAQDGLALDLRLTDRKGPILHGDGGYSQKGPDPGAASYYYSQTRLATEGTVRLEGAVYPVTGLSWKDHEFSTSALGAEQVGWDWFALQLDDGSELMLFQIRRADGSLDPFSSGSYVLPDGTARPLARADFSIAPAETWRSPHTGATYPARWRLEVPALALTLDVTPCLADQELRVSYVYWEGAVRVSGARDGVAVQGQGYVELTGYAGSMQGQF